MKILICLLLLVSISLHAQKNEEKEIVKFQKKMNGDFKNPKESPLTEEDLKTFNSLDFFKIDTSYIVKAKVIKLENQEAFKMKTNTDRLPEYKIYGQAIFELEGREFKLNLYQNIRLLNADPKDEYLFLPFTDLTNGVSTYGGGRYLDLSIPKGDEIFIDFNRAYNPYCAYNHKYSCPIPPRENDLNIEIKAGVKKYDKN